MVAFRITKSGVGITNTAFYGKVNKFEGSYLENRDSWVNFNALNAFLFSPD
jgi:hypothetical protein